MNRFSRNRFSGHQRQRIITFEDVEFLLFAESALLVPSLMLCLVIGQPWPIYLMIGLQILGGVLGAVTFKNPFSFLSCVPVSTVCASRRDPGPINLKKAA